MRAPTLGLAVALAMTLAPRRAAAVAPGRAPSAEAGWIEGKLQAMTLREKDGAPFKTDSGNVIYDCAFGAIKNAAKLATALDAITGVVEHGLFIGIASAMVIAGPKGADIITRR